MPTNISDWLVLIVLLINTYLTWLTNRKTGGSSR